MIAEWIKTNVLIDSKANYGRAPLTPAGVYELKVSDPHSRDIFYVAVCRSFGIAARLEPGTRLPQYYFNNTWHDVLFDPKKPAPGERVKLTLNSDPENDRKPEYYTHFTIEKFDDGFFRSLDYETDPRLGSFPCTLDLAPGYYLMVTGNRMKDGSVLANLIFFNLEQGKDVNRMISLRKEPAPSILGRLDEKVLYKAMHQLGRLSLGNIILAWMEPDKEPSRHFIAELKAKKQEFEKKGAMIFFLFRNEKDERDFISGAVKDFPAGFTCLVPPDNVLKLISGATGQTLGSSLPIVTLINAKGKIMYLSQGYRIGIGDDLIKLLR